GERERELDERVVVEAAEVAARERGAVGARLRPRGVPAVEAADVIGQQAAAVHEHDLERREAVERAAEDQAAGGQRGLEGEADEVVEIVAPEARAGREQERG